MKSLFFPALLSISFAMLSAAPLKVYILSGQSNMEGHAKISSFDHLAMDPKTVPILEAMRNKDGSSKVFENVRISYRTGKEDQQPGVGPLTSGFGARSNPTEDGGKIGPEFTFGIYTEQLVEEPILLIKTAWGGKSLHTDFRPPSAGAFQFREEQIEQFKKQGKDLNELRAQKSAATGKYYQLMIDHIKSVLENPREVHPAYHSEEGYELAGFVWFQGWNDMVARDVYPNRDQPGGYDDYSKLLSLFIRDVRKDLSAPQMPFVIGVMGAGGPTSAYQGGQKRYQKVHENFRQAMAAPAKLPEFRKNVAAVFTEKYWDPELDQVAEKKNLINQKRNEIKSKGFSKQEIEQEILDFSQKILTSRDHELLKGITNADYHYKGSAKIMAQIGKAFAEALHSLRTR